LSTPHHKNKIAIVGNPNVGKSTLFNQVTEAYSLVANIPYTTVSVEKAEITIDSREHEIFDTPGILSLDVQSEDGLITRQILMDEHPDVIIMCMDTNNMKRSFLLLAQVIELEIPMLLCLNFLDESRQKGISIKKELLGKIFSIPVVETVASEGRGIKQLIKAIPEAALPEQEKVSYKEFIEQGLINLAECFPPESAPAVAYLLLLLLREPVIETFVRSNFGPVVFENTSRVVKKTCAKSRKKISRIILEQRDRWAETLTRKVVDQHSETRKKYGETFARASRHPVFGWFILSFVVYITYLLVGKFAAGLVVPSIDKYIFLPANKALADLITSQLLKDFLLGDYGILTTGLENAVGTILPILSMFFILLNLLEDTGYIANLCVLCNRLFQMVGLSGKAILPVVLGFGCKTMATLATKILDTRRERYIAIFLIAFAIPCSSQLGLNLVILALFPFKAFLLVTGVLVSVEIIAGIVLNKVMKKDSKATDFIMELPPVRYPNFKNLMIKTYYRLKWFLLEAVPLFITGAFILFLMDKFYLLDLIKSFVFPVIVNFLNLPIETVDAFLLCLARHEAGAVILMDMVTSGQLDYVQTIVSIIIVTCFVPCFANIMAMIRELGLKTALIMVLVIILFSVIIGGIVNTTLRLF